MLLKPKQSSFESTVSEWLNEDISQNYLEVMDR